MPKKKINLKKIGNFLKPLIRETLQTLPIVGTLVTNFKSNSVESPTGQIKLTKWDGYRLILGLGIGYVLVKGIATIEQIEFIWSLIGF